VSDTSDILRVIQDEVGSCREWIDELSDRCNLPSEYVLWGKLIPSGGLGPRCPEHAAKWVGWGALNDPSWAIVGLGRLARRLEQRVPSPAVAP
jgi:hypothetical protein